MHKNDTNANAYTQAVQCSTVRYVQSKQPSISGWNVPSCPTCSKVNYNQMDRQLNTFIPNSRASHVLDHIHKVACIGQRGDQRRTIVAIHSLVLLIWLLLQGLLDTVALRGGPVLLLLPCNLCLGWEYIWQCFPETSNFRKSGLDLRNYFGPAAAAAPPAPSAPSPSSQQWQCSAQRYSIC